MNQFPPNQPWVPNLHWDTPAGHVLDCLVEALPANRTWRLIVFGSAPLQLGIDKKFLSADVDIISQEEIGNFVSAAHLAKGQAPIYVEPCPINTFTAAPDWQERAYTEKRKHVVFIFPHPIDILVSKIKRLEEKDLNAFRLVYRKTQHPTEEELKKALGKVVDIYRPNFDEEAGNDPLSNTRILWRELYGKNIDVRNDIVIPALTERNRIYEAGKGIKVGLSMIDKKPKL